MDNPDKVLPEATDPSEISRIFNSGIYPINFIWLKSIIVAHKDPIFKKLPISEVLSSSTPAKGALITNLDISYSALLMMPLQSLELFLS